MASIRRSQGQRSVLNQIAGRVSYRWGIALNQQVSRLSIAAAGVLLSATFTAAGVLSGADVSALPEIEKAGGVFRDKGAVGDEIEILRSHGCQLFRVRLFVDPNPNVAANYGATQGLDMVRKLGQRIKKSGGQFLLDIHYSDTWADPSHQTKPKAWKDLDFAALEARVTEYTALVLADLQQNGADPDMVQVGNEITSGILWPDARLSHGPKDKEPEQWRKFTRLLRAGVKAVRASERDGKRTKIVLHIHGGGREGLPQWFFREFMAHGGRDVDFDVIGLSFYPAWKDAIGRLKQNMADLVKAYDKEILLAEVAYPWAPVTDIEGRESMEWPMTPEGQAQYLRDTQKALAEVPNGRGLGWVWWYSDSIPVPGMHVWRDGNEAVFDHSGNPLPVLNAFAKKQ